MIGINFITINSVTFSLTNEDIEYIEYKERKKLLYQVFCYSENAKSRINYLIHKFQLQQYNYKAPFLNECEALEAIGIKRYIEINGVKLNINIVKEYILPYLTLKEKLIDIRESIYSLDSSIKYFFAEISVKIEKVILEEDSLLSSLEKSLINIEKLKEIIESKDRQITKKYENNKIQNSISIIRINLIKCAEEIGKLHRYEPPGWCFLPEIIPITKK